jgi:hypothetical protein
MPTSRNTTPDITNPRGRKGAAVRDGRVEDAQTADRDLRAAMLEKTIRELALEKLPPLTDTQRFHLAGLLSGAGHAA